MLSVGGLGLGSRGGGGGPTFSVRTTYDNWGDTVDTIKNELKEE